VPRDCDWPLATGHNDGINNTGLAAHAILDRAGIDVTGWGGQSWKTNAHWNRSGTS